MVASLLFPRAVVISLSFLAAVETLTCPGPSVVISASHCLYVIPPNRIINTSRKVAEHECELLNEGATKWNLPKLDAGDKDTLLTQAIEDETSLTGLWFIWIDLLRDDPMDESEALDVKRWGDQSKWRWTTDGSTLASSFPTTSPPWQNSEPNNQEYINHRNETMLERCVLAVRHGQQEPAWTDAHCSYEPELLGYAVVCESSILVSTTPAAPQSATTASQSATAITDGEASGNTATIPTGESTPWWPWIVLGVAITAVVVSTLVLVGVLCFVRSRRRTMGQGYTTSRLDSRATRRGRTKDVTSTSIVRRSRSVDKPMDSGATLRAGDSNKTNASAYENVKPRGKTAKEIGTDSVSFWTSS